VPNKEQVMHDDEFRLLDDEKGEVDEATFKEDHLKHISKEDCSPEFLEEQGYPKRF
jgi:hypothetical protein